MFPILKGRSSSVEDSIISLLPNQPCLQNEDFHEEGTGPLMFCFFHHAVKAKIEIPIHSQVLPAFQAEWT
jgi:hypothetical protein